MGDDGSSRSGFRGKSGRLPTHLADGCVRRLRVAGLRKMMRPVDTITLLATTAIETKTRVPARNSRFPECRG